MMTVASRGGCLPTLVRPYPILVEEFFNFFYSLCAPDSFVKAFHQGRVRGERDQRLLVAHRQGDLGFSSCTSGQGNDCGAGEDVDVITRKIMCAQFAAVREVRVDR